MLAPLRIDAHHHLWRYTTEEYAWIDDTMPALRRDFLWQQLAEEMNGAGVAKCVAVQARQSMEETRFLLTQAAEFPRIAGVVGWVPLAASDCETALNECKASSRCVGVREIAQGQPAGFLDRPDFNRGVALLAERELVYDLLIFSDQLPEAARFVDRHPQQQFVLDHCAKPRIAAGQREPWESDLLELAKRPNVVCKVSGMVTEARWKGWTLDDLRPYIDVCMEAFGPKRLMVGSDWPVCLVASAYTQWWQTLDLYFGHCTKAERADVFAGTVLATYGLTVSGVADLLQPEADGGNTPGRSKEL